MNKYVKKGLCLVLATGLIASSFAGCAKVNYVTEGAIKAIHQIKDGSWKKQAEGEEAGSSEDTSVLEKSFEAGKYGSTMLLTIIKRLMITLRLLLPSMSMIRVRLRLSTSSSVMRKLM